MFVSGKSIDNLVEMVEVPSHPFFVACQFHPEFKSTPRDGHPLFSAFVSAAGRHIKGNIDNRQMAKVAGE